MRTNLTTEDIKNIIEIAYQNNDEEIVLVDESGNETTKSIVDYLDIKFYAYKERVNDVADWLSSINTSFGTAYALVEMVDEDVTASQDIDAGMKLGQITYLLQTDKVKNFEYYHNKVKNFYLGNPQSITNAFGEKVSTYLLFGTPQFSEEPITLQIGECIIITCSFKLNYLGNAFTYNDYQISMSLDGDDEYDEQGNIVGETKFLSMPITQATFGDIFTEQALPTFERPDLTGFVISSLSQSTTISFYDFNVELANKINDIFWKQPAYRIDGILQTTKIVNIPIFIKVVTGGHSYIYKDVITSLQKDLVNNDFVTTSISLKGYGKIIA